MIDAHARIRVYLASQAVLTALTGSRIYAARDVPPVGYTPDSGACVVFKIRSGGRDYEDALLAPSVQFKCYGLTEVAAWACYCALVDALHNGHSTTILHAEEEGMGTPLEEPETRWPFVLSFFTIMIRQ